MLDRISKIKTVPAASPGSIFFQKSIDIIPQKVYIISVRGVKAMMIDYKYEANEKEMILNKLQRKCRECMDLIEAYEELRGNPEVNENELEAAIKEENEKLTAYENEIVKIVWKI